MADDEEFEMSGEEEAEVPQGEADVDVDAEAAPEPEPTQTEEAEAPAEEEAPPPDEAPGDAPQLSSVDLADAPDQPEEEEDEEEEAEEEEEESSHIEPLGQATSQTLLDNDVKPFILEKMFHEASMGRLDMVDGQGKLAKGAISLYEDYQWQLEKLYRQVPEDMALGHIRLKPDALMYEEEKWVLGKLFRELGTDFYEPKAEPKSEDVPDTSQAIEVNRPFPNEPKPCFPPPSEDDECCCPQREEKPCGTAIMGSNGKVYEFSFSGLTAVSVDSENGGDCSGEDNGIYQPPMAPMASQVKTAPSTTTIKDATSVKSLKCSPSAVDGSSSKCAKVNADAAETPASKCEARIEAVCKAARNAMAIYDTLAGTDNFPCNLGDKEDAENAEDNVWGWLYQAILKIVPCDDEDNQNLVKEVMSNASKAFDQDRPDDLC